MQALISSLFAIALSYTARGMLSMESSYGRFEATLLSDTFSFALDEGNVVEEYVFSLAVDDINANNSDPLEDFVIIL
jgi:hypothetical protein